eukprot:TRINITY_DN3049_c0_g1_i1.p1 TRINITY_DN3049_c0_g1~~TRINITY_DN3049_c0_g1_i1.p1  ORF type:complete len:196 (-),score=113.85 TRINITY_DN3049_c0_g1_i1:70-657(-)
MAARAGGSVLNLRVIETEFTEFTSEELQSFRECFRKYDLDSNGQLEVFELHQLFESLGETKTNAELVQLINDADQSAKGGIDYREFLSVMLKAKKGLLKGSAGLSALARIVAKQHDESKETGKKANVFEQKAADQANDRIREEEIKRQAEVRKKQAELKKKLAQEEREAAEREVERKRKVAEGLSRLKANINKPN